MKIGRMFSLLLIGALIALPASGGEVLKLATTTSTENTGLLTKILPPFEKKYDLKVAVIAVGTGRALKHGENGDVDVVMVHAPKAEMEFVEKGFGVNRRSVMHNDFLLIGPPEDPAGIKGMKDPAAALKKIAEKGAVFISRGDDSGTHKKELNLWEAAGVTPKGAWYLEVGQGMGQTLTMADEKQGYTLVDRGTYLAYRAKIDLPILCEGDKRLFNPYSIIAVDPARYPHVNYMGAMGLIGWFTSQEGQKIIGDFKVDGQILFVPDAIPQEAAKK